MSRRIIVSWHARFAILVCAVCAAATLGCKREAVPVSGRVTLNGKPLPGAVVGDHTVTIAANTVAPATAPAKGSPIPPIWRDGSRQFRVPPGGTTAANFDITA